MSTVTEVARGAPDHTGWAHRYPPLLAMAVAVVIALVILPSTLNLPQTNPTQTLEYAPVPPDENDDSPPDGNVSALGLGSSSAIEGGGASGGGPGGGPTPPPPPPDEQGGAVDADFECVGNPPRQTRDPLAPPCVPFFEGDNGGATYQGVTENEVRLLFYMDGGIQYIEASNTGNQSAPTGLYDIAMTREECERTHDRPQGCGHLVIESLRVWQEYFNKRFQTYGRFVHFWVYLSTASNEVGRRADAALVYDEVKPFGVVSVAVGAEDSFLVAMALRGVLDFGSFGVRTTEFFTDHPKKIWSYLPSAEQQAEQYLTYVCDKVIPHPVALGDPTKRGQPRKLGIVHTTDHGWPGLLRLAELTYEGVPACGGAIADKATFGGCCVASTGPPPPSAQQKMASFQQQGITTILWTGGISNPYVKGAHSIGYRPEWIILGDTLLDAHHPIRIGGHSPGLDGTSVVVTPQTYQPALEKQGCFEAFREINKTYQDTDLQYTCNFYRDLFQFFVGVQVAGPYLGPTQVDKGFRAIPQHYDGRPNVPACFYLPGDYTCVKDATAMYWDAAPSPPGDERPGCWRAIEDGRRYGPGRWPAGNIDAQVNGTEPCSGYDARVVFGT